jgi:protein TonB
MNSSKQETPQSNLGRSDIVLGNCLVDDNPSAVTTARRCRREAFGISLTIEILILGLVVAAPLFSSVARPQSRPLLPAQLTFFHTSHPPNLAATLSTQATTHRPQIVDPFQPVLLAPTVPNAPSPEMLGDPTEAGIVAPYVPGADAIPMGQVNQFISEQTKVAQPVQFEKRPLKLSQGVLEAELINRIEPRYPSIAVQTKTEGVVLLHALIGRDGRITSLEVVNGNPLLIHAALDAVQQWRYRPTMLSGEPVEVETTITVVFKLRN